MNVHCLQHAAFEGPGAIEDWLLVQGHRVSRTRFYEPGFVLPEPADLDALIVLGGPMSVYDDHEHAWLAAEKAFIEDCILDGKRVLGICLGAQLMALCLGATVYTAVNREIGWFPVTPTAECRTVPWLHALFEEQPVVFHWHGEKFDLPYDESLDLLSSEANGHQAFLKDDRLLALQFHLETTAEGVRQLVDHCGSEAGTGPYAQTAAELIAGLPHLDRAHRILGAVLAGWLGAAERP